MLNHLILRIPSRPREFLYLTLQTSHHQLCLIDNDSLKRGSITITNSEVIIAFSKQVKMVETSGRLGIDVNERNVTWSDTTGRTEKEDTLEIAELKARYGGEGEDS